MELATDSHHVPHAHASKAAIADGPPTHLQGRDLHNPCHGCRRRKTLPTPCTRPSKSIRRQDPTVPCSRDPPLSTRSIPCRSTSSNNTNFYWSHKPGPTPTVVPKGKSDGKPTSDLETKIYDFPGVIRAGSRTVSPTPSTRLQRLRVPPSTALTAVRARYSPAVSAPTVICTGLSA